MPQGPLPRWTVLAAFAVGLALQLVQAYAVGDRAWVGHHVAQFGAGAAVWLFTTWPRARGFVRVVALAWLTVLVGGYVLNAFGALPGPRVHAGHRGGLWFRDPNLLGIAVASTAAVVAMLVTRVRWTALLGWSAALAVAIASWSRGATIALVLGALVWGWTRFGARGRWRLAGTAAVLAGAGLFALQAAPEPLARLFGGTTVERFVGGGVLDPVGSGGVFARLRAHAGAWTIARATVPWGAGHGGFEEAYRAIVDPVSRYVPNHAHHQALDLLATGGVPVLLAWMLPLLAATWGLGGRGWWVLAPMAAVQGFLWGTESPLLFAGAFYATWTALGVARQAATGAWTVRPPCERVVSASPAAPPR